MFISMKMKIVPRSIVLILLAIVLLPGLAGCGSARLQSSKPVPTPTVQLVNVSAATLQTPAIGIGIMGDSNSDEYQAEDARGGKYNATTLNWVELLARTRGLDFGPWGTWDEPRRTGYEYNWARTGATASTMLSSGQHTGLAKQVAAGKVTHVFMWIGDNDFSLQNGTYEEIYQGYLSDEEVQAKVDQFLADVTTAVDTVLDAGDVKMVIVTVSDKGLIPQAAVRFPDAEKRQRVSQAIQAVNAGMRDLARKRGITVMDINAFAQVLLSRVNKLGFLKVGNEKINILISGDEPHHLQLSDKYGHAGTVASGLVANSLFVEPFNNAYGLGIAPLTDEEILQNAGIR